MIGKLRAKLICAAMASLLLVLVVIFGIVGILNYQKIAADADSILSLLQSNDGRFPDFPSPGGKPPTGNHSFSPELPYETRYFSVFLTTGGRVLSVNTGKIAAVDTQTAISYAGSVLADGKGRGFADDYRYIVYETNGEIHMIFLDYSREMRSFRSFLITGAAVSAGGLASVLILLIFLSGKIVKPFSENYEKQKQFITDAGHELKTPLTIIDADAEVLEMDLGENEWLRDIQAQTKRLAELTNSLIFLSRMEEQPHMEKIPFPVSDVVQEMAEGFEALAKARGKTLTCRISPMLSMNGDEKAIRQLVSILLDNAVKYTDDQGRIEITLEKQKNTICLKVCNTTEGVSQESLSHLFERFYRADKSRNSQTGGYGLGLSIALAIVNAHKGKITAATQDEKSLLITASFPQ